MFSHFILPGPQMYVYLLISHIKLSQSKSLMCLIFNLLCTHIYTYIGLHSRSYKCLSWKALFHFALLYMFYNVISLSNTFEVCCRIPFHKTYIQFTHNVKWANVWQRNNGPFIVVWINKKQFVIIGMGSFNHPLL